MQNNIPPDSVTLTCSNLKDLMPFVVSNIRSLVNSENMGELQLLAVDLRTLGDGIDELLNQLPDYLNEYRSYKESKAKIAQAQAVQRAAAEELDRRIEERFGIPASSIGGGDNADVEQGAIKAEGVAINDINLNDIPAPTAEREAELEAMLNAANAGQEQKESPALPSPLEFINTDAEAAANQNTALAGFDFGNDDEFDPFAEESNAFDELNADVTVDCDDGYRPPVASVADEFADVVLSKPSDKATALSAEDKRLFEGLPDQDDWGDIDDEDKIDYKDEELAFGGVDLFDDEETEENNTPQLGSADNVLGEAPDVENNLDSDIATDEELESLLADTDDSMYEEGKAALLKESGLDGNDDDAFSNILNGGQANALLSS